MQANVDGIITSLWTLILMFNSVTFYCLAQIAHKEKPTKEVLDQLMTIMNVQMNNLMPEDRNSFIDLCIIKHQQCTEEEFSGKHAIFRWRPGIPSQSKDRFWLTYTCAFNEDIQICPVNGGWTEWSVWSKCHADCEDKGLQVRTRVCDNPKVAYGGDSCEGAKEQNRTCVGRCQASADGKAEAEQYLVQIHQVFPELIEMCMDKHCIYDEVLKILQDHGKVNKYWSSISCVKYVGACPVNGGWREWEEWGQCSTLCGQGERIRLRRCDNPTTKNGGIPCQGEWFQKQLCLERKECGSNAGVTQWSEYSPCSESCGKYGRKESMMVCLSQNLRCFPGQGKTSHLVRQMPCYGGECPKNGGWGSWQLWTGCSAECGTGRRTRYRLCNAPYPAGGEGCLGSKIQTSSCDGSFCIQLPEAVEETREKREAPLNVNQTQDGDVLNTTVNTVTSQFTFVYCEIKDDSNHATVFNQPGGKCRKPNLFIKPQTTWFPNRTYHHGRNKTQIALLGHGLVRLTKDASLDHRSRRVVQRRLSTLGLNQAETLIKSGSTSSGPKQVSAEGLEPVGRSLVIYRHRRNSKDDPTSVEPDDPYNFPLNPDTETMYTAWSPWTSCSVSCGGGVRGRTRSCKDTKTVCRGEVKPNQFCNLAPCPVEGGWGSWLGWNICSATCGQGVTERYRTCDNPLPQFGGTCPGPNVEVKKCSAMGPCTENYWTSVQWTPWTSCSKSCGGGTRKRNLFGYRIFYYKNTPPESVVCNTTPCPENGLWAAWGGWSRCSEPCGIGSTVRDRTCTDPAPIFGGNPCEGGGSDLQTCYAGPCLDQDDYGILLEGDGFLVYPGTGKPSGFFMFFARLLPLTVTGTIFHHVRDCKKDLMSCECSIHLTMDNGVLVLTVKAGKAEQPLSLQYTNTLVMDKWQDVLVIVTESWAEIKVDDGQRLEKPLVKNPTELLNFEGELTVGCNRLKQNGFHGKIGALRKNFKMLLLFGSASWSGYGMPNAIHNVKKIQLDPDVRHPDFNGRYYSHLYFHDSGYFHVTASFQVTGLKGLLLFNAGTIPTSFLSVAVVDGALQFCLSCGSKAVCHKAYELKLRDWFLLRVVAKENDGQIRLNDGDALQIMCPVKEKYQPRSSVYVSGAGAKDWAVMSELTKNMTFFSGRIDTLTVNGLPVTYKMATLIDYDDMINILGYSLSNYVTEVYRNSETMTSLLCGVPEKAAKIHFVQIIWFENMKRLLPSSGVEIVDVTSSTQVESKLNLYPGAKREGVYACVYNQDGMLSVAHVFLVFNSPGRRKRSVIEEKRKENIEGKEVELNDIEVVTSPDKNDIAEANESHREWLGLIILLVLILVCFCPGFCYCVTKDHAMWEPFKRTGSKIYCRLSGKPYVEATEEDDDGDKNLLDHESIHETPSGAGLWQPDSLAHDKHVDFKPQQRPLTRRPSIPQAAHIREGQALQHQEPPRQKSPVLSTQMDISQRQETQAKDYHKLETKTMDPPRQDIQTKEFPRKNVQTFPRQDTEAMDAQRQDTQALESQRHDTQVRDSDSLVPLGSQLQASQVQILPPLGTHTQGTQYQGFEDHATQIPDTLPDHHIWPGEKGKTQLAFPPQVRSRLTFKPKQKTKGRVFSCKEVKSGPPHLQKPSIRTESYLKLPRDSQSFYQTVMPTPTRRQCSGITFPRQEYSDLTFPRRQHSNLSFQSFPRSDCSDLTGRHGRAYQFSSDLEAPSFCQRYRDDSLPPNSVCQKYAQISTREYAQPSTREYAPAPILKSPCGSLGYQTLTQQYAQPSTQEYASTRLLKTPCESLGYQPLTQQLAQPSTREYAQPSTQEYASTRLLKSPCGSLGYPKTLRLICESNNPPQAGEVKPQTFDSPVTKSSTTHAVNRDKNHVRITSKTVKPASKRLKDTVVADKAMRHDQRPSKSEQLKVQKCPTKVPRSKFKQGSKGRSSMLKSSKSWPDQMESELPTEVSSQPKGQDQRKLVRPSLQLTDQQKGLFRSDDQTSLQLTDQQKGHFRSDGRTSLHPLNQQQDHARLGGHGSVQPVTQQKGHLRLATKTSLQPRVQQTDHVRSGRQPSFQPMSQKQDHVSSGSQPSFQPILQQQDHVRSGRQLSFQPMLQQQDHIRSGSQPSFQPILHQQDHVRSGRQLSFQPMLQQLDHIRSGSQPSFQPILQQQDHVRSGRQLSFQPMLQQLDHVRSESQPSFQTMSQQQNHVRPGSQPSFQTMSQQQDHVRSGSQPSFQTMPQQQDHVRSGRQPSLQSRLQQQDHVKSGRQLSLQPMLQQEDHVKSGRQLSFEPMLQQQDHVRSGSQPSFQTMSQQQDHVRSGRQPSLQSRLQQQDHVKSGRQLSFQPMLQQQDHVRSGSQPSFQTMSQQQDHVRSERQPSLQSRLQQQDHVKSGRQPSFQPMLQQQDHVRSGRQPSFQPMSHQQDHVRSESQPSFQTMSQQQGQVRLGSQPSYHPMFQQHSQVRLGNQLSLQPMSQQQGQVRLGNQLSLRPMSQQQDHFRLHGQQSIQQDCNLRLHRQSGPQQTAKQKIDLQKLNNVQLCRAPSLQPTARPSCQSRPSNIPALQPFTNPISIESNDTSFANRICLQMPPERSYVPKCGPVQSSCDSHDICRPVYNPYAFGSPYTKTPGSLPTVDLLCNPFYMSPFTGFPGKPDVNLYNTGCEWNLRENAAAQQKCIDKLNFSRNNSTPTRRRRLNRHRRNHPRSYYPNVGAPPEMGLKEDENVAVQYTWKCGVWQILDQH